MPTYTVQLDGLLSTTNSTEGPLCAAMFATVKDFLLNNAATLGTQLIAEGGGFAYSGQRLQNGLGPPAINDPQANFIPADPGCVAANAFRKGYSFYVWDVVHGGTSGQWCCIRFASASVPFDVFLHNFSGSRTREGRPTATWTADTSDSIPNQQGYRTNTFLASAGPLTNIDCPPLSPSPGGNDYSLQTRTEEGIPSAFTEGDYTIFARTGFYYLGLSRTTGGDQRMRGGGFAIQIAQRADGGEPWSLGTGNQTGYFIPPVYDGITSASLLTPNYLNHWTAGGSTLGVFPISNATLSSYPTTASLGGNHATSSNNLYPIMTDRGTAQGYWQTRYHLLADRDNLLIVTSDASNITNVYDYKFCYFGKYITLKEERSNYPWTMQVPYVFLATNTGAGNEPTIPVGRSLIDSTFIEPVVWGSWQGFNMWEGGAWYPSASQGVTSVMLDLPNRSRDPSLNPNRLIGNGTPQYDRYSIGLWLTGSAGRSHPGISYLGRMNDLIRAISGLACHDQTADLKFAVVGNSQTTGMTSNFNVDSSGPFSFLRQKMVIPWNGSTLIGANSSPSGLTGSITTVLT